MGNLNLSTLKRFIARNGPSINKYGIATEILLRACSILGYTRSNLRFGLALAELAQTVNSGLTFLSKRASAADRGYLHREMESLLQLYAHVHPHGVMPLSGGWALSSEGLLEVVRLATRENAQHIVECGSGTSTVWLAHVMEKPGGHVTALEHEAQYADQTSASLEQQELTQYR
jgi:hypothetical protein